MTRPTDPYRYSDQWAAVLLACESNDARIVLGTPRPMAVRLEFYSYRAAWNAEATRFEMRGMFDMAAKAKKNFRTLCAYAAVVQEGQLLLIHQGIRQSFTIQTSGEQAFSIVDRSVVDEYKSQSNANTSRREKGIDPQVVGLPSATASESDKRKAEHERDKHIIKAGYGTPFEAQYFSQSEWESLTGRDAPEDLKVVFNTGFRDQPADNPIANAVASARALKLSEAEIKGGEDVEARPP